MSLFVPFWGRFVGLGVCRGLPGDRLEGMRFAVFGLGDSGFRQYNAAGKKLHARLLQLGAAELVRCWGIDVCCWLSAMGTAVSGARGGRSTSRTCSAVCDPT